MSAGRADIQAGAAFIRLYTKNADLLKGLREAKTVLNDFGSGLKTFGSFMLGIGGTIATGLGAAVQHFISVGSALNDMSARTGVAASALVAFKFAAEQTGGSIEDVETAIRKLQVTLAQAVAGSAAAKKEFRDLGVSVADLAGAPPGKQFEMVAAAIAKIPDPAKRAAAAVGLFGKSGTKLLPMLTDLRELTEEAQKLGLAPSDYAVAAADALGDAFDKIKSVISATAFEIGASLAEPLMEASQVVIGIVGGAAKWVKENKVLIQQIAGIAVGMVSAGAFVYAFGGAVASAATILSAILDTVTFIGAAFAVIVSPVGLIVAGVVLLLSQIKDVRAAVKDAFAPMVTFGKEFEKDFTAAWKGVVDAVAAGDLKLAFEVAIAGVKLAWTKLIEGMKRQWLDFKAFIGDVADEAGYNIAYAAIQAQRAAEQDANRFLNRNNADAQEIGRKEINEKYNLMLSELEAVKKERRDARYVGLDANSKKAEEELQAAKDALDALILKSRQKAMEYGSASGPKKPIAATGIDALSGKTLATFSAAALIAGMGGPGKVQEVKDPEALKMLDKMNKRLEKLEMARFAA